MAVVQLKKNQQSLIVLKNRGKFCAAGQLIFLFEIMITLKIDTSDNKELKIGLDDDNFVFKQTEVSLKAENTLEKIDSILKEKKLSICDISEIKINRGPGSFTGLKVGVAIGNALSFSLAIPINDKKLGEIEIPAYS